jgi:hypothetical protein
MTASLSALSPVRFVPPGRFLVLNRVRGWVNPRAVVRLETFGKLKESISSGTRTGYLPACSIVPQPTTLSRAPEDVLGLQILVVAYRVTELPCSVAIEKKTWLLTTEVNFPEHWGHIRCSRFNSELHWDVPLITFPLIMEYILTVRPKWLKFYSFLEAKCAL